MPVHLRILARGWPYRWLLVVDFLAAIATSAMFVVTPQIIGHVVDVGFGLTTTTAVDGEQEVIATGTLATLTGALLLLAITGAARGGFQFGQQFLNERISQHIAFDFRHDIYQHLQRLSFAYHDQAEVGQIMSRATQDVEGVRMFVSTGLVRVVYLGILIGASATLMFMTNVTVAIAGLALMPLVALQSTIVSMWLRPLWRHVQHLQGELANVLQQSLTAQRVVKAFARERHEEEKFDRTAFELFSASYRTNVLQGINEPVLLGYWLMSAALVFWFGAQEIAAGTMTAGDMAAFQLYLAFLQQPIRMISMVVQSFARAGASGTRIFEILDAESPVQERPEARTLRPGPGDVRFDQVDFAYEADQGDAEIPVLRDVSLHAEPGQVVAVMGPTGSGKTTLVNLIPRFYDVTGGRVLVDGEDVRDVTLASLRAAVGIVQQDVYLFPTTLRENIRYGRPGATDAQVVEAAQAARIHEFIETLPEGYDSWVGERGITLSGGQRQRVAIARTILLNPRILIFDDSTSSVDMRTEYLIQQALQNLMTGRTTFVIAQRLRTVKLADQILVLDRGEVVERGTHDELLEAGGLYRQIYDIELRDQEEAAQRIEEQQLAADTTGGA